MLDKFLALSERIKRIGSVFSDNIAQSETKEYITSEQRDAACDRYAEYRRRVMLSEQIYEECITPLKEWEEDKCAGRERMNSFARPLHEVKEDCELKLKFSPEEFRKNVMDTIKPYDRRRAKQYRVEKAKERGEKLEATCEGCGKVIDEADILWCNDVKQYRCSDCCKPCPECKFGYTVEYHIDNKVMCEGCYNENMRNGSAFICEVCGKAYWTLDFNELTEKNVCEDCYSEMVDRGEAKDWAYCSKCHKLFYEDELEGRIITTDSGLKILDYYCKECAKEIGGETL